jgi:hypothetical protein
MRAGNAAVRLKSVETTPNPNSMKLNLHENIGAPVTYEPEKTSEAPEFVRNLLAIEGVKSVFACGDFLTINKDPRAGWREILRSAASALGAEGSDAPDRQSQRDAAEKEGQVQVLVQTFRDIPIQVKVVDAQGEARVSLGERFNAAAMELQKETGADYLKERYWADHGVRYGEREQVANEVADELRGMFDERASRSQPTERFQDWLNDEDWHRRLTAVQQLSGSEENIALLAGALKDSNPQVRRMAAAGLGATGSSSAVPPLSDALINDPSVGVRRTAGDALSDIGDPSAESAVCQALSDSNKLVRWRAARFLCDIGTEAAIPYLEKAVNDAEFEVHLEVEAAIQRIRGGGESLGPAWKRIVES